MKDDLVRDIEARVDIVDLVSEDTELTRRGGRYWGLCPFHGEKTPSFSVSAERQLFYCFGCHKGGSIVQFL
ncbi:MAG: CHC2 zinc finger domain-containing protein, partial [Syntrophomonadaceae bacterium]|nr:CHC2 zinc finger domain-containing protein [Syntrophomonadaceae bacterium]